MRILVTDNEAAFRKIYRMVLEPKGHTVVDCLDYNTLALEAPNADLIIADYHTFVKFESVLKYNRPTILASGTPVNFHTRLDKPFTRAELLTAVEKIEKEKSNAKTENAA